MGSNYCHPALKQLKEQQARFAPKQERLEQVDRAETLLGEIQAEKQYPYEYLWYRIKGYRPETAPELLLEGAGVRHDLRLFIEDLSGTVGSSGGAGGGAGPDGRGGRRRFNVSTRTITRWRRQCWWPGGLSSTGALGRVFRVEVMRFVESHRDQVDWGLVSDNSLSNT